MKKIIALVAIIALLMGSTFVAYSYWDTLQQDSTGEYEVGYGVILNLDTKVQDDRELVPAGSFYAAYEDDYTTSYVLTYTLNLEEDLKDDMKANLDVDITDFEIAEALMAFNADGSLFTVKVGTDEVAATASTTGEWTFTDAYDTSDNEVVVTVTIELADNNTAGFDAEDYAAVAGNAGNFTIGFELVNNSSSSNQ